MRCHEHLKRRRRFLGAERMQQPDDAVRLKPVFGFVHKKDAALSCSFALKPRDQKPCRSGTEAAQRNALFMKRDRAAAERH
jgi:hypothetical protein